MAKPKALTTQAGKGGAGLPEMGALLRFLQGLFLNVADGAPVAAVANVQATGTITVADNTKVTAGDTLTVGATELSFVTADPGESEVEIGQDATETRDNILAALAGAEDVTVEASSTAAITVTAVAAGAAGNAIDLAVVLDTAGGITLSGAKLSGGVDQVKGTAAPAGSVRVGGGKAYIAVADTTETDTSGWKEITLS